MVDLVIQILTFLSVTAIGGALLAAWWARRATVRARLAEAGGPANASGLETEEVPRRSALQRIAAGFSIGRPSQQLKTAMTHAGYYHVNAAAVYQGVKLLLFLTALVGLSMLLLRLQASLSVALWAGLCGAAILFFVPNVVVAHRRTQRRQEIRHNFPDALDLLQICVASGMGMDMAWNSVSGEIRGVCPTLADEMALTNLELHLGAKRNVAMRRMARRAGVEEISTLAAVLIQSERFGTSISDALHTFADGIREKRSQQAAENAEKMAVKLLFPMVILIFPAILVVTVGPAAVAIAEMLGR